MGLEWIPAAPVAAPPPSPPHLHLLSGLLKGHTPWPGPRKWRVRTRLRGSRGWDKQTWNNAVALSASALDALFFLFFFLLPTFFFPQTGPLTFNKALWFRTVKFQCRAHVPTIKLALCFANHLTFPSDCLAPARKKRERRRVHKVCRWHQMQSDGNICPGTAPAGTTVLHKLTFKTP